MIMNMILSEYKQEVEDEFGECTILHSKYDHEKKNCENTEGRIVYKCVTWIDYWRAMAGMATATMCCSSCGKEISVGELISMRTLMFSLGDDKVGNHRAHGDHIS